MPAPHQLRDALKADLHPPTCSDRRSASGWLSLENAGDDQADKCEGGANGNNTEASCSNRVGAHFQFPPVLVDEGGQQLEHVVRSFATIRMQPRVEKRKSLLRCGRRCMRRGNVLGSLDKFRIFALVVC